MLEVDVTVPPEAELAGWEQAIEAQCVAQGLRVTLKGSLAQYPGSRHWHFKQGRQRGTLELTLWPQGRRLWFKVSSGRTAAWIEPTLVHLKENLERLWDSE